MIRIVALVLLVACTASGDGGSAAPRTIEGSGSAVTSRGAPSVTVAHAVGDAIASMQIAALIERADLALEHSLRLDPALPGDAAFDRSPVANAYAAACDAGAPRGCWMAISVIDWPHHEKINFKKLKAQIAHNCDEGDMLSCRAIDDGPWRARRRAPRPIDPTPCPAGDACAIADARYDCQLGFFERCKQGGADPAVAHRLHDLVFEGCRAGLVGECHGLADVTSESINERWYKLVSERRFALEQICKITLERCDDFAATYFNYPPTDLHDDPTKRREALERACQLGEGYVQRDACRTLLTQYESVAPLQEPLQELVPGRAKALRAWLKAHPAPKLPDYVRAKKR